MYVLLKMYGSAVTIYEQYPAEKLTSEQKQALGVTDESEDNWTYNINKCICLLSRWPFFDTNESFLLFLHDISRSSEPQPVPIERLVIILNFISLHFCVFCLFIGLLINFRFITYFLEDIPFPSPQRPRILAQLSVSDRVMLTQPEDLPLPRRCEFILFYKYCFYSTFKLI